MATMSSGEGAEESAKDAGDIAAFFKSGKPGEECGRSDTAPPRAAPSCPAMGGTMSPSPVYREGENGLIPQL